MCLCVCVCTLFVIYEPVNFGRCSMFWTFGDFEPRCSYKIVLIKKECIQASVWCRRIRCTIVIRNYIFHNMCENLFSYDFNKFQTLFIADLAKSPIFSVFLRFPLKILMSVSETGIFFTRFTSSSSFEQHLQYLWSWSLSSINLDLIILKTSWC